MTLVRTAKAHEIETQAEKNSAEAYATKILADAQAALTAAEIKLKEANAKLIEAQAETEKAQAAKLLAEAAYAQAEADLKLVNVDQQKVELQRMQEELKAQIAEYDARIAAAQAEKTYWEYAKQMLDKELEIALVQAEAALYEAKTELEAAKIAYAQALRDAEDTIEGWAEQDIQDLRDKVEELMGRYYAAAAELLNIEHDLIHEEIAIAEAEQGIVTATELKGEMIEYNNREIARLTKVVEYLETLVGEDPEDIKDQLTDLFIEIDGQKKITDAAEEAYMAVYDQMWANTPNHEGDTPYDVTYTFTEKFFNNPDVNIAYLPNIDLFDMMGIVEDEDGDYVYFQADLMGVPDPDDPYLYHQYLSLDSYDYFYDELKTVYDQVEMWSAYYGPDLGMKNTPARYPELGEGISFDVREPYTVVDHYEFVPLQINREGYEDYVGLKDMITDANRDADKEYFNELLDNIIALNSAFIDRYQAFVDAEATNYEKMGAKIDETVSNFMDDWNDVLAKYQAFDDAMNAYIKKYQIDNNVDRTEALIALINAYQAWQAKVTDPKGAALEAAVTAAKAALDAAIADVELAKQAKADFENNEGGVYALWQLALAAAKMAAGEAEKEYNLADKDFSDLEAKAEASEKAYNDKLTLYLAAVDELYEKLQDYADAYAAWQAAGADPDPSNTLNKAQADALANYTAAAAGITTMQTDLAALETTMNTDAANLATAEADLEAKKTAMETAQENLQTVKDIYPKGFDDDIAAAEAAQAEKQAAYDKAVADQKAFQDELDAAKKAYDDAFAAWKAVAGNDDEFDKIVDLQNEYYKAVGELGNPVYDLLYYYGIVSGIDYKFTDFSDIWINPYEADEFDYYAYMIPFAAGDPDFDVEDYIYQLLYVALYEYFNPWMPSAAFDFMESGVLENLKGYEGYDDWYWYPSTFDFSDFEEWVVDLEDYLQYAQMSPLGAYFASAFMLGELADEKWDNGDMWYSEYIDWDNYLYLPPSIDDLKAQNEAYEAQREPLMAEIDAEYDEEIAENHAILDAVDDVLSYEDVYTAAVEELNALAAQLPDLQIAWWEEQQAFNALDAQINETYFVKYADAQALADRIAQYKEDIKDLEDENEDWSAITELEHGLVILKGIYELDKVEYDVKKTICASLKAEFDAAYAELQATLAAGE